MPRTVVTLAAALLLVPLAIAQAGPLDVRFDPPAQAGPAVTALDATWLLLVFGPEGSGRFSLQFPHPAQERNITVVGLASQQGSVAEEASVPATQARDLPGFSAEARFPEGLASLYLQGDRLRVEVSGARASLQPRLGAGCMTDLLATDDRRAGEARYDRLCPPGGGAAVVLGPEGGPMPVRIEAEGLEVVEYHHARLSCHGAPDCPGDGPRQEHSIPGLGISSQVLRYARLESSGARVAGAGEAQRVLAGAPAFDVAVQGWVRLPLADIVGACAGCEDPGGRTLRMEGNLTLAGLRTRPDGGLAAALEGDVRAARVDERGIDPGLLRGIGAACASVAGAAAAAWAVRALAAFFSRIPQAESLDHPRRRSIMEAIRENPGIHLRALARLAGGGLTLVQYHVDVLVRNGHAIARRRGRQVCLFENHGRYGEEWKALAALRERPLLQLHGLVGARPGMSRLEVVRAALESWGWSRRTTYHRLRRLERLGLVQLAGGPGAGLQALKVPVRPAADGGGSPAAPGRA